MVEKKEALWKRLAKCWIIFRFPFRPKILISVHPYFICCQGYRHQCYSPVWVYLPVKNLSWIFLSGNELILATHQADRHTQQQDLRVIHNHQSFTHLNTKTHLKSWSFRASCQNMKRPQYKEHVSRTAPCTSAVELSNRRTMKHARAHAHAHTHTHTHTHVSVTNNVTWPMSEDSPK